MAQHSVFTGLNRYPHIFRTVRALVASRHGADLGGGRLRILSFGCSTGEEMASLRMYFPDADIVGCDINQAALAIAANRHGLHGGRVFLSNSEGLASFGPFDVIFAMSVLCLYPQSKTMDRLDRGFSYDQFSHLVGDLHNNLRSDGVMCIYNANFSMLDLPCANSYSVVLAPEICDNGFVEHFSPDGAKRTVAHAQEDYHAHRFCGDSGRDPLLRGCIFLKNEDGAAEVEFDPYANMPAPHSFKETGALRWSGMPEETARAGGWVAAHVSTVEGIDDNGDGWTRRQFYKTDARGENRFLGTVWRRSDIVEPVIAERRAALTIPAGRKRSGFAALRKVISGKFGK